MMSFTPWFKHGLNGLVGAFEVLRRQVLRVGGWHTIHLFIRDERINAPCTLSPHDLSAYPYTGSFLPLMQSEEPARTAHR